MKTWILVGLTSLSSFAFAQQSPTCMDHGRVLEVNNEQVIEWKHNTQNEYHNRAHTVGTLTDIYPDATGHHHIEMTLSGPTPDTIELIYNEDFGSTPRLVVGQKVEACGDYITSNAPYQRLPASPDGAIIHWLHRSDSAHHDSGFLIIDGTVTGL